LSVTCCSILLRSNWLTAELWPETRQHCLVGLQKLMLWYKWHRHGTSLVPCWAGHQRVSVSGPKTRIVVKVRNRAVYGWGTACYSYSMRWFFSHSHVLIPIPMRLIPIPIPFLFPWLIVFPFPWESHGTHGIPVFPIPMHTSTFESTLNCAIVSYRIWSRISLILIGLYEDRLVPKWMTWPLFTGRLRSRQALGHIRRWISRKPLATKSWFQRPPIGNGLRGIKWSRDRWCYVTPKCQIVTYHNTLRIRSLG